VSEVQNRNRALEGDEVAVLINDQSEWRVLQDQINDQVPTFLPLQDYMLHEP
jgi:hypothetical protein